ncbi:MAG TPA: hypothetical protein VGM76_09150 [Lacipirellulaceae bacterium]
MNLTHQLTGIPKLLCVASCRLIPKKHHIFHWLPFDVPNPIAFKLPQLRFQLVKVRTRYSRFSLKALLIALTIWCICIGEYSYLAHRQRKAVDEVRKAGGEVYYSHQLTSLADAPGPLRRIIADTLGEEWAYTVTGVIFYPDQDHPADDLVRILSEMPHLQRLSIWPESRGTRTLSNKASFGLTDEGVDVIVKSLPHLAQLCISAARVSDEKIDELRHRKNFTSLQIFRHPDFGSERAIDTWPNKDGSFRIVDLRKDSSD